MHTYIYIYISLVRRALPPGTPMARKDKDLLSQEEEEEEAEREGDSSAESEKSSSPDKPLLRARAEEDRKDKERQEKEHRPQKEKVKKEKSREGKERGRDRERTEHRHRHKTRDKSRTDPRTSGGPAQSEKAKRRPQSPDKPPPGRAVSVASSLGGKAQAGRQRCGVCNQWVTSNASGLSQHQRSNVYCLSVAQWSRLRPEDRLRTGAWDWCQSQAQLAKDHWDAGGVQAER